MNKKIKPDNLSLTNLIKNTKECDKSLVSLAEAMVKNIMASKQPKKESPRLFAKPRFLHTVARP